MCLVSTCSLILDYQVILKVHCRGYKDDSVFKKNCYNPIDVLGTHMGMSIIPYPSDPLTFFKLPQAYRIWCIEEHANNTLIHIT